MSCCCCAMGSTASKKYYLLTQFSLLKKFGMARVSFALVLCLVAYVRQASCSTAQPGVADPNLEKIFFTTHPTGQPCAGVVEGSITGTDSATDINCDGGFERLFTYDSKYNIFQQQDSVSSSALEYTTLRYEGTLQQGAFVSLVDTTLSLIPGNPCSPVEASHSADQLHSGPMTGTSDGTTGNGKVLRLQQDSSGVLLQSTKEFAVCYTAGNGTAQDNGWSYANIVIRTSRLSRLDIYDKRYRSCGTSDDSTHGVVERPCVIPNHPDLILRYYGTIDQDKWVSLVDDTINGGNPCSDPNEAAGYKDGAHSGSRHAAGNLFTVDTAGLDATKTFAVCYSENGGIQSSLWRDAGLRLQRSAITRCECESSIDSHRSPFVAAASNMVWTPCGLVKGWSIRHGIVTTMTMTWYPQTGRKCNAW